MPEGQIVDLLDRLSHRLPRFWAVALLIAVFAGTVFLLAWVIAQMAQ